MEEGGAGMTTPNIWAPVWDGSKWVVDTALSITNQDP